MDPLQRPRLRIARSLVATALLLAGGAGAQAQGLPGSPAAGGGPRLTPEQRQRMFPPTRTLALQDHQARIAILQQGQSCISAAANGDALRQCMRQERQAIDAQRNRHREALRQAFQRAGIPVPDWSQRQGRRLGGPAAPGGAPDAGQGWAQPTQPGAAPF